METTTTRAAVASNVRAGMARRRLTQSALADALGMTQQALSRRLTGVVPFDVDELHAIADQLGVGVLTLMADPESAPTAATGT